MVPHARWQVPTIGCSAAWLMCRLPCSASPPSPALSVLKLWSLLPCRMPSRPHGAARALAQRWQALAPAGFRLQPWPPAPPTARQAGPRRDLLLPLLRLLLATRQARRQPSPAFLAQWRGQHPWQRVPWLPPLQQPQWQRQVAQPGWQAHPPRPLPLWLAACLIRMP